MSDSDAALLTGTPDHSDKFPRVRRLKACKQCHALKVRCTPVDEHDPALPCVRCVNGNKTCEIDNVQPRKRRRKAVKKELETVAELRTQVAELQDQLRRTASALALLSQDAPSPPFMTKADLEKELSILGDSHLSLRDITEHIKTLTAQRDRLLQADDWRDVVLCGIIDAAEADRRLRIFQERIYPRHPVVKLPPDTTVESLRLLQPYLFNAVMAVASMVHEGFADTEVAMKVDNHAIKSVVMEVVVVGTKSVELVKSLILLSLWYNIPGFFKLRRFHILNNVAVTLLHDLGIPDRACVILNNDTKAYERAADDRNSLDYRSLILVLYFSTVSICLILRRAIYVRWTPYVEETCVLLEHSGAPCYKDLATFARLNHELERIHHIVHQPEAGPSRPDASKYVLVELQTKLAIIKSQLKDDQHHLRAFYYSVEAYLHQPMIDDLQVNRECRNFSQGVKPKTLTAIAHCTASCLFALDEFNKQTPEQIAALPLFFCSRVIYTAGILMRLRFFIMSLPSHVEKELVPQYGIFAVLQLDHLIQAAAKKFPSNFFLKRMALVVQLFTQTYVTQIKDIIQQNNGVAAHPMPRLPKKDMNVMARLATALVRPSMESLDADSQRPCLHLDLLSYAAAYTKSAETEDKLDPSQEKSMSLSPMPIESMLSSQPPQNGAGSNPPTPRRPLVRPDILPDNSNKAYPPSVAGNGYSQVPLPPIGDGLLNNGGYQPEPGIPMASPQIAFDNNSLRINEMFADESDTLYFDDEFWSNLLTAGTDKLAFALNAPAPSGNVLFRG